MRDAGALKYGLGIMHHLLFTEWCGRTGQQLREQVVEAGVHAGDYSLSRRWRDRVVRNNGVLLECGGQRVRQSVLSLRFVSLGRWAVRRPVVRARLVRVTHDGMTVTIITTCIDVRNQSVLAGRM